MIGFAAMESTEEQLRKRLHSHCLVWIKGAPEECIEAAKEEASALQMMFGNSFIFFTVAPDDVLKQAVVSRAKMMAALEWLIKNNIWYRHSRIPDHSSLDYDSASADSLILISQTVPSASAGSQVTPG